MQVLSSLRGSLNESAMNKPALPSNLVVVDHPLVHLRRDLHAGRKRHDRTARVDRLRQPLHEADRGADIAGGAQRELGGDAIELKPPGRG